MFKPFPGPYPTRWRLIIYTKNKVLFDYWGKPNHLLIPKITRLTKIRNASAVFVEFDQLGAFRFFHRQLPWLLQYGVQYQRNYGFYAYYPWLSPSETEFFAAWRKPCFLKKLIAKTGHVYHVYSPFKEMFGKHNIELEEYFAWRKKLKL